MRVYVFKTSVEAPGDIRLAELLLRPLLPGNSWNFDLEDCDNILRVESDDNIADMVCTSLQRGGIHCEELP